MAKKKRKEAEDKTDNSHTVAILSYITIIGWIIALILNNQKKSDLGSFHIRQSLMLMITGLVVSFIPMLGMLLWVVVFVFWVMGLVYAIQKQKKEVPLIGKLGQQWFKRL